MPKPKKRRDRLADANSAAGRIVEAMGEALNKQRSARAPDPNRARLARCWEIQEGDRRLRFRLAAARQITQARCAAKSRSAASCSTLPTAPGQAARTSRSASSASRPPRIR